MTAIYVLIMLWSTTTSQGGVATITQEFTSRERCEYARVEIAKAHEHGYAVALKAQGCFLK